MQNYAICEMQYIPMDMLASCQELLTFIGLTGKDIEEKAY